MSSTKSLREEDLQNACRVAFSAGYNGVKLYFMMGLPTETDEDLLGISSIARNVLHNFRENASNRARGVRISVGVSTFVPKAQTPFQWCGQIDRQEIVRRQQVLMDSLKIKNVTYSLHGWQASFLEAVLARGGRVCTVIEGAWRRGSRLDGWDECFDLNRWLDAFEECGADPAFYANRELGENEITPWDHIFSRYQAVSAQ